MAAMSPDPAYRKPDDAFSRHRAGAIGWKSGKLGFRKVLENGPGEWSRTITTVRSHDFESCASASSATPGYVNHTSGSIFLAISRAELSEMIL